MQMMRVSPPEEAREWPGAQASRRRTEAPARRRCQAVQAPKTPAPTTVTSGRVGMRVQFLLNRPFPEEQLDATRTPSGDSAPEKSRSSVQTGRKASEAANTGQSSGSRPRSRSRARLEFVVHSRAIGSTR